MKNLRNARRITLKANQEEDLRQTLDLEENNQTGINKKDIQSLVTRRKVTNLSQNNAQTKGEDNISKLSQIEVMDEKSVSLRKKEENFNQHSKIANEEDIYDIEDEDEEDENSDSNEYDEEDDDEDEIEIHENFLEHEDENLLVDKKIEFQSEDENSE